MFFWDDFIGSLKGGSYYGNLLTRPIGKGWLYMLILMAIGSVILAIPRIVVFNSFYDQTAQFIEENFDSLQFAGGSIVNMPTQHIEQEFGRWIILIDTSYTDSLKIKSHAVDSLSPKLMVFVGPNAVFIKAGASPSTFNYPTAFNQTMTSTKLKQSKMFLLPIFILIVFVVLLILNLLESMLYILLIGLMIVFKFRSIGLSYRHGFHLGLYLITLQFVIALVLNISGIALPYEFLWYVIMYILYVGLMVNINLNKPQENPTGYDGPISNG